VSHPIYRKEKELNMLTITVLCENTASKSGVLGEHGLSFFIQENNVPIIFDTGAGMTIEHNAKVLNCQLSSVKYLVLSHGHYDHTGGIQAVLQKSAPENIFAHPFVFEKRYIRDNNGSIREIGYRGPEKELVTNTTHFTPVLESTQITETIYASGPIPRTVPFEKSEPCFYLDPQCTQLDTFPDDQCLFIDSKDYGVVLLGCTHSGVINTLTYLRKNIMKVEKKMIVIGGLHLHSATEERLKMTTDALLSLDISALYPCHCSGFKSLVYFNTYLPFPCLPAPAGSVFNFYSS